MTTSASLVCASTLLHRSTIWDTQIPELVTRTLDQWCAPLMGVVGPANKALVLGILYDTALEQQQRRPYYAAFAALDPLVVRDTALQMAEEAQFEAYLYLEASRRLLHELRQIRLVSLGYTAQPGLFESLAETRARLQHEEAQQQLLRAGAPRPRPIDPVFEALFHPRVSVPTLLKALQLNELVTEELTWVGRSGKDNELMALVAMLEEGGYFLPTTWSRLMRVVANRFQRNVTPTYASKRAKANPSMMEQLQELFPGQYAVRMKKLRWKH